MKNSCLLICCIVIGITCTTSCSRISYYSQSIQGQWEIFTNRRPIEDILQDQSTPPVLYEKLAPIAEIRKFANEDLKLPVNNNYLTYVDLKREYVVWNVFATPDLSLKPVQWCFLVVGCLSYQGFFNKDSAINLANELKSQGYDVFVGGVSAYSTLGWFNDSILNTMSNKGSNYLATVIFHELAHQKIYIQNDTEFNEAFAETIALVGTRKWLEKERNQNGLDKFVKNQKIEDAFVTLVLETRDELELLYQSKLTKKNMLDEKEEILEKMRKRYQLLKSTWNDDAYDAWFQTGINNAKIAAVTTYRHLIPAFARVLEKTGYDYEYFYQQIRILRKCPINKRRTILESAEMPFICGS